MPQINEISRTIASHRTIDDLTSTHEAEFRKEKIRKDLLEKETENCTFKPKTNMNPSTKSEYAQGNEGNFSENLKARLKAK